MADLSDIVAEARALFSSIRDSARLEEAKAKFLGKTGSITEQLKGLAKLPAEAKKAAGEKINQAKGEIEAMLNARRDFIESEENGQPAAPPRRLTSPCRGASRSAAGCIR